LRTAQAGDLWIADRNFCTREFLAELDSHGAFFGFCRKFCSGGHEWAVAHACGGD
jgi:hypothetical protein